MQHLPNYFGHKLFWTPALCGNLPFRFLFLIVLQIVCFIQSAIVWFSDESDDEDGRPSRRRRLGERAAEGADEDEDDVRCHHFNCLVNVAMYKGK